MLVSHDGRIRILQVQGALAAGSSHFRSNTRKTLAGLKESKKIVSYTSEATGKSIRIT
jgi:hypothetical protein